MSNFSVEYVNVLDLTLGTIIIFVWEAYISNTFFVNRKIILKISFILEILN